ncbi:MAG: hypothetical protein ISR55_02200 [Bacteroidetes bacterium]|nr:hypothetical protein [Bacteroidota bacterium]
MKFSEVAGQDNLKEQLITSIQNNMLSHALLFVGEEGYGGLPLVLALAQYLNCQQPVDHDSCGNCPSCRKLTKHIHPDIHYSFPTISDSKGKPSLSSTFYKEWRSSLIENPYLSYFDWLQLISPDAKQGNITMAECHAIIRNLSLKAFDGRNKIQIIWSADHLGPNGNTLLKIIEEPTPNTYFFFLARNKDRILNTILSRAQLLLVPPISIESISEKLNQDLDLTDVEINQIAKLANGNYANALRLSKSQQSDHEDDFISWMRLCYEFKVLDIFQWGVKLNEKGREYIKDFLQYGMRIIRECMLISNHAEQINSLSKTEEDFARKFSLFTNDNNAFKFYELLSKTQYYIERNANPKIIFFNLSLHFHKLLKQN